MMRDGVLVRVVAGLAFGIGSLVSAQSSSSSIRIVSSFVPASSISSIPASSVSRFQSSPTGKIQSVVSSQTPLSSSTSTSQTPASPSEPSASALPACALTCDTLTKAQSACRANTPLANLQTNATLYRDCFCHSPAYHSLQSSHPSICTTSCPSPTDIAATQSFYQKFCNEDEPNNTTSTSTTISQTPTGNQATNMQTPQPSGPRLSKNSTIAIAIGASIALLLLCALAYYPVFAAGRRATHRSRSPSLAGSHHRRGSVGSNSASASKSRTRDTSLRSGMETDEEAGAGAPVAEIARSPGKGMSRRGSGDVRMPPPGSPRAKELVHVISVAAFKE
jgi:hypothetical protein